MHHVKFVKKIGLPWSFRTLSSNHAAPDGGGVT
jgi:hypothetical protein